MYTTYNVLDPKIIENILKLSELNKDLNYEELMIILKSKPNRYSVTYTENTRVLHINDNEGLFYFDINIDIHTKKIYILFMDNRDQKQHIVFNFNYTQTEEELDIIFNMEFNDKYPSYTYNDFIRYISKTEILAKNPELLKLIQQLYPDTEYITNKALEKLFWLYYTENQ